LVELPIATQNPPMQSVSAVQGDMSPSWALQVPPPPFAFIAQRSIVPHGMPVPHTPPSIGLLTQLLVASQ
jgi:hypothetical protein